MGQDNPDLGAQALNKVAELSITSQLDEVEQISVNIQTNPGKLLQGEVDAVAISGRGLIVKQDLRMETLEVSTDKVAISPLSALFGNLELTQPTAAQAQIVLTEADINRAFNSNYIQDKLQGFEINIAGCLTVVDVQQVTIRLPGDNKFAINANFVLRDQGETKSLSAVAIPQIKADGHQLSLEILSAEGQGLTTELIMTIFNELTALLDLRNFNIPGISLQLQQLDAQLGRLMITAQTQIDHIPST